MKKILIILAFLPLVAFGQQSTYQDDVKSFLNLNGTTQQYEGAIDGLFDLLQKQYKDYSIEQSVWDTLKSDAYGQVNTIKAMLVSAYRGTYEHEDIKNLITFYNSDSGKKMKSDPTSMTDDDRLNASVFYGTPTGQKVLQSQQLISDRVGEVSELWSRNLYISMIDKLAEKGYIKPE